MPMLLKIHSPTSYRQQNWIRKLSCYGRCYAVSSSNSFYNSAHPIWFLKLWESLGFCGSFSDTLFYSTHKTSNLLQQKQTDKRVGIHQHPTATRQLCICALCCDFNSGNAMLSNALLTASIICHLLTARQFPTRYRGNFIQ